MDRDIKWLLIGIIAALIVAFAYIQFGPAHGHM